MVSKKYEASRDKFSLKLFEKYPTLGQTADEVFAKIASYDPTAIHKNEKQQYLYLEWMCARILKETPRPENFFKIRDDIDVYLKLARIDRIRSKAEGTILYNPYVAPEINQYTIASLAQTVFRYGNLKERKKPADIILAEQAEAEKNSVIVYNGVEGRIVIPLTIEASQHWGRDTKWCISASKSDNLFEQYHQDGKTPILIFIPKGTREKFATNEYDRNVRDMLDGSIGGSDYAENSRARNSATTLGMFLAKVFSSPGLDTSVITADKSFINAFQEMALRAPLIYQTILDHTEEGKVPDFLHIPAVIEYSKRYAFETGDQEFDSDKNPEEALSPFYSVPRFLEELNENPQFKDCKNEILGQANFAVTRKPVFQLLSEIYYTSDDILTGTPEELIADFKRMNSDAETLKDKFEDIEALGNDLDEEMTRKNLKHLEKVPQDKWKDADFAIKMLETIYFLPSVTINMFPDAYQHPKIWQAVMEDDFDLSERCNDISAPEFQHIWLSTVDGIPFLEAIIPVVNDLDHAEDIYNASKEVNGLDYTPLVKAIEKAYSDGFENAEDVEIVTAKMPKCDFSALLEKTIAKHPEFFADVSPDKQTMAMAIAAVTHDPGSLADIAADLFLGKTKPPELVAAFNKLTVGSTEWQMVEHYFIAPEVS